MIIIPMAGESSRFRNQGFLSPKYMLSTKKGKSNVFVDSVRSFENYFSSDQFLFILNKKFKSKGFVEFHCEQIGITNFKIIEISESKGQAETVFLGLNMIKENSRNEPIYIFNIDTVLLDFKKLNARNQTDGYMELFIGSGNHWSFAKIDEKFNVLKVEEKLRISKYCSNGLYFFKSVELFISTFKEYSIKETKKEFYVAPMYNYLLNKSKVVKSKLIDKNKIQFIGTPEEYYSIL